MSQQDVGHTKLLKHSISVGNALSVRQAVRCIPVYKTEEVQISIIYQLTYLYQTLHVHLMRMQGLTYDVNHILAACRHVSSNHYKNNFIGIIVYDNLQHDL